MHSSQLQAVPAPVCVALCHRTSRPCGANGITSHHFRTCEALTRGWQRVCVWSVRVTAADAGVMALQGVTSTVATGGRAVVHQLADVAVVVAASGWRPPRQWHHRAAVLPAADCTEGGAFRPPRLTLSWWCRCCGHWHGRCPASAAWTRTVRAGHTCVLLGLAACVTVC